MTLSEVSPSDAVSGDSEGASGDAGEESSAGADGAGGRATSPSEVFMSTSPDLAADEVQRQSGLDLAGAHTVIMVRKMLTALVPSADGDGGMPAIGNGVLAAYHWFTGQQDAEGDDDDDGGNSGDVTESEGSFRTEDVDTDHGISPEQYRDPAGGGAPA